MQTIAALQNFIAYLRVNRNASTKTVEQYEFHIFSFLVFLEEDLHTLDEQIIDHRFVFLHQSSLDAEKKLQRTLYKKLLAKNHCQIASITREDCDAFRFSLANSNRSVQTANAYMISLRAFFKFLKKR